MSTSRKWSLMSSSRSSSSNFSSEGYRVKKRSSRCHVVGFWKRGFLRTSPGWEEGSCCPRGEQARPHAMFPPVSGTVIRTCRQERSLLRQCTRTSAGRGGLSQAHPASAGSSFITCSFSRTTPDRLLLTLLTYPKPSEACRNVHATDTGRSMPAGTTKKPLLSDPEAPPGAAWGQGR